MSGKARALRLIVTAGIGAVLLAQPASRPAFAGVGDAWPTQKELDALRTYVSSYKLIDTASGGLALSPYYANSGGEPGYYQALCSMVAVGALVKDKEPSNPNVDWLRAKSVLVAGMQDYTAAPLRWGIIDGQPGVWTGHNGFPCALAAAILWNKGVLSESDKSLVRSVLADLATDLHP